jgi:tRNA/tmRNA/rRNA uracil-C5-methylase (TrmA/RlmC/RlmD family)
MKEKIIERLTGTHISALLVKSRSILPGNGNILAGSSAGGVVLDPFNGSGTTGIVALKNGRSYIGIELNPEYCEITKSRVKEELMGPTGPLKGIFE